MAGNLNSPETSSQGPAVTPATAPVIFLTSTSPALPTSAAPAIPPPQSNVNTPTPQFPSTKSLPPTTDLIAAPTTGTQLPPATTALATTGEQPVPISQDENGGGESDEPRQLGKSASSGAGQPTAESQSSVVQGPAQETQNPGVVSSSPSDDSSSPPQEPTCRHPLSLSAHQ